MQFTEIQERLIKEIYARKELATVEDLNYVLDLIDTDSNISEVDRKIVKLRIIRGLTYREISRILDLEKEHTAQNRFKSTMRYLRKQLRIHNRPDDGTEQLSKILSNKNDLLKLSRHGIYTVGQFMKILKEEDLLIKAPIVSSIVYTLELSSHKDLRSIIKNHQVLEDLEDIDRRNYVHVDQLEAMLKNCSRVKSVERITNSYTTSSKTEFGSFDVELNDSQVLRLKVSIKSTEDQYALNAEIEETESFEGFEYQKTVSREVSTDSENLDSALNFLLFVSRKSVN